MLKLPPNISVEICVFKVSVMSEVHAYAMFRCAFLSQLLDAPNTASFVWNSGQKQDLQMFQIQYKWFCLSVFMNEWVQRYPPYLRGSCVTV